MGTAFINIQKTRIGLFFNLCLNAFLIIIPSILFAQPAYDLKIEKPVAIAPYKIWQKDQVYGFGGMANVNNLGTKAPQNQKTKLDIYDSNSMLVWSDSILNNGINVPMLGKFIPNGSGSYKGVYSVSQDSSDYNISDNKVEFEFELSDSIMAKENVVKYDNWFMSGHSLFWGNVYHITNDKSKTGEQLYCNNIQIGIGNATALSETSKYIIINLFKWDNINNNDIMESGELLTVGSTFYIFKPEDPNGEIISFRLNDINTNKHGVKLEANTTYIAELEYFDPIGTIECLVLIEPSLNYGPTSLRDSIINESNYGHHMIWDQKKNNRALGTYENSVPVIRMVIGTEIERSYVSGKVYLDFECDSIFNNNDELLPSHILLDKNSEPVVTEYINGEYLFSIDTTGIFEYSPLVNTGIESYPSSYIIENDSLGKEFLNKDFGLCFVNRFHDLEAILTPYNPPTPGITNNYDVCIKNKGSFIETAKLIMDFKDANADTYIDIIGTQGGKIAGNTITWDINKLKYFDDECYKVTVKVVNNTPLGTIFTPHLTIVYDSSSLDITPLNNDVEEDQVVVGSYDPNDKTVNKVWFTKNQLDSGIELEYVIRFQNTGTAWADLVEVYDTLQNNMDINRFEMLSSSHNYTMSIIDNNILKWRFDDINLPDSSSLEAHSHGFIKFRIHSKENLTEQEVIANSAAIYFDFNTPVFTDTAKTSFLTLTSNNSISTEKLALIIYPNPVSNTLKLEYTQLIKADCYIELIDPTGKVVETKRYPNRTNGVYEETIDMEAYASGIYLIRVVIDKYSGEVKVIKQ